MSFRTSSFGLRTSGTAGRLTGWNAHQPRCFCVTSNPSAFAASAVSGQTAPPATHRVSCSISFAPSFILGGIFRSPVWPTAFSSRLSPGLPGTTAGPLSPPFSTAARPVRLSPPLVFLSPWHDWHFSTISGRISFSKNSAAARSGAAGWAARTPVVVTAAKTQLSSRCEMRRTRMGCLVLPRRSAVGHPRERLTSERGSARRGRRGAGVRVRPSTWRWRGCPGRGRSSRPGSPASAGCRPGRPRSCRTYPKPRPP